MELYVWGPIGHLPSIDAECIAAVAYLARVLETGKWRVVGTTPEACGATLPALYDGNVWISGYSAIVTHVSALNTPPEARNVQDDPPLAALLSTTAQPLIDTTLYFSSDNWTSTTRPAFATMLGFPLSWTLPLAVRNAATARAERLVPSTTRLLEMLEDAAELDEVVVLEKESASTVTQLLAGKLRQQSVVDTVTKKVVRERLEDGVRELLAPITARVEGEMPLAVECLVYGHLALLGLEMPQNFTRNALSSETQEFIKRMRRKTPDVEVSVQTPRFAGLLGAVGVPAYIDRNAAVVGVVGYLAYRGWRALQPFGLPVHTYSR